MPMPQIFPAMSVQGPPMAPQQPPMPPGMPVPPMMPPPPKWHDVVVVTKRTRKQAKVMPVPPEEFGISRFARTLKDAGYAYHEVIRREEDLVADGYDWMQIKDMPTYTMLTNPEELSRDTVDEHLAAGGDQGINQANRQIKITEHYIRTDYEGNGKVGLWRITTGGDQGDILKRDGEDDIHQEDFMPFAAITPIPVTHRFFGRSLADIIMDIQRIKTALIRGTLDGVYLALNGRMEVAENAASDNTLDDLLVSRPGGIVRVKTAGCLTPIPSQNPAAEIFPVIQYMDNVREWRTGVSRTGQGLDPNALQNQSATAAAQMFTAAQARMKLIARIFAETGIRDLFSILHAVIRKNGSQAQTVRLRSQWVEVDPRDWKKRDDMTINVGLGTGSKAEQLQKFMMGPVAAQQQLVAAGKVHMVPDDKLYNSAKEIAKLSGQMNPDQFFTDPTTVPPPPPPPPDPKLQIEQMKAQNQQQLEQAKLQHDQQVAGLKHQGEQQAMQTKAQLEQQKLQSDVAHQATKNEAEARLAQAKFQMEREIAILNAQLDVQKAEREHQYRMAELQLRERESAMKVHEATKLNEVKAKTMTQKAKAKGGAK